MHKMCLNSEDTPRRTPSPLTSDTLLPSGARTSPIALTIASQVNRHQKQNARGPLRPHRATLRQLTLRRTPRSQEARLYPAPHTPHAAHALAYNGWLEGELSARHSLSWESCARFKRADDFFRARTRALLWWSHINRKFLFVWFA